MQKIIWSKLLRALLLPLLRGETYGPEDGTGPSKSVSTTTGAEDDVATLNKMNVKPSISDVNDTTFPSVAVSAMDKIEAAMPSADDEARNDVKDEAEYDEDIPAAIW